MIFESTTHKQQLDSVKFQPVQQVPIVEKVETESQTDLDLNQMETANQALTSQMQGLKGSLASLVQGKTFAEMSISDLQRLFDLA